MLNLLIKSLRVNPGRQDLPLTMSINPIIADPEEWYGLYYWPLVGHRFCLESSFIIFVALYSLPNDIKRMIFVIMNRGHPCLKKV